MPMCSVPPEERRLGLHAAWYDDLSEKEFLEALALILLVALAIAFEQVWHCILHRTEHSYRFGDVHVLGTQASGHGLSHRRGEHHQLAKELVARAGAEFMTLGFLALVIFTFKQAGGFKMMLRRFPAHLFAVPNTEDGWLYLFKFVDMQLFVGMCLYFIVAAFVTKASLAQMRKWEEIEVRFSRRRTWALENMQRLAEEDCEMWLYLRWRNYLLQKLVSWQRTRPSLFRHLCRHLSVPEGATAADGFRRLFQERFAFGEYLAWNLEADIKDAIEIHPSTWLFMMVLLAAIALAHLNSTITLGMISPIFVAIAFALAVVMWIIVMYRGARIQRQGEENRMGAGAGEEIADAEVCELSDASHSSSTHGRIKERFLATCGRRWGKRDSLALAAAADRKHFYERHSFNSFVFQLLQMVLFMISYTFAATLLAFDAWKEEFELRLLAVALLVLLFCIFIFVLPLVLPIFLGTMALPPFMDDRKLEVFLAAFLPQRSSESECRQTAPPSFARDASLVVARSLSAREDTVRQELLERGYRVPEGAGWGLLCEMLRLVLSAEGRDEERSPQFSPIRENSPEEERRRWGSPGGSAAPAAEEEEEAERSGCKGGSRRPGAEPPGPGGGGAGGSPGQPASPRRGGDRAAANAVVEAPGARRTRAWSISL